MYTLKVHSSVQLQTINYWHHVCFSLVLINIQQLTLLRNLSSHQHHGFLIPQSEIFLMSGLQTYRSTCKQSVSPVQYFSSLYVHSLVQKESPCRNNHCRYMQAITLI